MDHAVDQTSPSPQHPLGDGVGGTTGAPSPGAGAQAAAGATSPVCSSVLATSDTVVRCNTRRWVSS